ncbi:hypothetical protein QBC41DRAFT_327797 [Cercophora samala]|uniref:2EXR domain-containing protein n=1 Tax=Cercophora samala TaxID=330535 RepID=A0AA40D771_9PEZI|nr:hypothetical protein QBC41DRAFT_327797 [Cercophora samala]
MVPNYLRYNVYRWHSQSRAVIMLLRSLRIVTKANATPAFPFDKLPQELQDEVWKSSDEVDTLWRPTNQIHDSLDLARDMIGPRDANGEWLARYRFEHFVSRRIPTLAHVCRNSRQIIKTQASAPEETVRSGGSLWYKNTWNDFYGRVIVIEEIYAKNKQSLLPILPKDNYLVLGLPSGHRRTPISQGRRLLEVILAAKHDQVKVLLPGQKHHKLSNTPADNKLAAQARLWYNDPLLVSIHDLRCWNELRDYCRSAGETWPFVESILEGQKVRDSMVEEALEPIVSLWNRENKHREGRGLKKLKPLPTIDVVVDVWLTHSSAGYSRMTLSRGGWD